MSIPFVSIVGTTECDAHCPYCDRWREPVVTMDPYLTCRMIDQFPALGVKVADITGGQPGLWEGTPRILWQCFLNRIRTSVTVSGPSALNLLRSTPIISYLRVSCHGTRANHDRFQGDGFYDANVEFLEARRRLFKDHYRRPELIFTIREAHTEEDFEAIDQLAWRFNCRILGNIEWGLKPNPQLLRLIYKYKRRAYWTFSLAKLRYWQRGGNNILNPTCAADRMLVLHNNSIAQPCMEYRHVLPAIPLYRWSQLADLLDSPERQSWQKMTGRWGFCQGCTISCPNLLGLALRWKRRYASWLHLPTVLQGARDAALIALRSFAHPRT